MERIAVIGTGYVGLTTGACLAHLGHSVVCADVVPDKVALLQHGKIPIREDGLEELVRAGLEVGRLRFVLGAINAVTDADFVFLCLPTPQDSDGSADLSYLRSVAEEIADDLRPGAVVINKSTVPVGSVEVVADILSRPDVTVVSNPEFLREGSAVHDCLYPDRIVIGGNDATAIDRVADLFSSLDTRIVRTDAASAETIKYAANAFLATRISFINAIAGLCEAVGSDVESVIEGIGLDHRIGFQFLNPGPGWGGSCLPKDTRALVRMAEDAGYDFMLLRGVIEANRLQQEAVIHKIERMLGGTVDGATVAAWGLAFKAGTDDLRDSPALAILRPLVERGARVRAYDPAVTQPIHKIDRTDNAYEACRNADVLVILTEWPAFTDADLQKVFGLMASPRIVDARNVLDPVKVSRLGFAYEGIGRRGWIDLDGLDAVCLADGSTVDDPSIDLTR